MRPAGPRHHVLAPEAVVPRDHAPRRRQHTATARRCPFPPYTPPHAGPPPTKLHTREHPRAPASTREHPPNATTPPVHDPPSGRNRARDHAHRPPKAAIDSRREAVSF